MPRPSRGAGRCATGSENFGWEPQPLRGCQCGYRLNSAQPALCLGFSSKWKGKERGTKWGRQLNRCLCVHCEENRSLFTIDLHPIFLQYLHHGMQFSPVRSPGNFEGKPLSNTVELPNVCCTQFGARPRFPDSGVRSQNPSSTTYPALLSASSVHPETLKERSWVLPLGGSFCCLKMVYFHMCEDEGNGHFLLPPTRLQNEELGRRMIWKLYIESLHLSSHNHKLPFG